LVLSATGAPVALVKGFVADMTGSSGSEGGGVWRG
jgi:hypothetical protein